MWGQRPAGWNRPQGRNWERELGSEHKTQMFWAGDCDACTVGNSVVSSTPRQYSAIYSLMHSFTCLSLHLYFPREYRPSESNNTDRPVSKHPSIVPCVISANCVPSPES